MSKDPAFLFYYQDFLVGTAFMTLEERGAYITLLCYQAASGYLTEEKILKLICSPIWDTICCKFKNENGHFYNVRLKAEIDKRKKFTESRRKNLHMRSHMESHMEGVMTPHMENENENKDEDKKYKRRGDKKTQIHTFLLTDQLRDYAKAKGVDPDVEIEAFTDYHKARASLFKDWGAAWRTWVRNSLKFNKPQSKEGRGMTAFKEYLKEENEQPDV